MVRTADAAAQLVQLGEAEFVGPVDGNGIGIYKSVDKFVQEIDSGF
jgi:hypothetical protein